MSSPHAKIQKLYTCATCNKSSYKSIVPGAVSFFTACTLTAGCTGQLTIDSNAVVTPRSELTWKQTPFLVKHEFSKQRYLYIQHNFGHLSAFQIEVFIEYSSTIANISRIKTGAFDIVSQDANLLVLDMRTQHTGVVVVTDNQFNSPLISTTTAEESTTIPALLDNTNILTIAADIDVMTVSATLTHRKYSAVVDDVTTVEFRSHSRHPNAYPGTVWTEYRVIAIEKPMYLYSAVVPQHILATRGTAVSLGITGVGVVIPLAVADKTNLNDIITTKLIRNGTVRMGDILVDNNQLVVANSAIVEELRKPFTIF